MIKLWIRNLRLKRIAELEQELGPYTIWGSGPYGSSSWYRRDLQLELATLRKKVGLPQESNWLVDSVLRIHNIR